MEIKTFDEALCCSGKAGKYLLLGNGFSCAYNSCFRYKSLFEEAKLNDCLIAVFDELETQDFEHVIRSLEITSRIMKHYGNNSIKEKLENDAESVRTALAEVITRVHPQGGQKLDDKDANSCLHFLDNFETIYTLNYDLLLYWVITKGRKQEKNDEDAFGKNKDSFIGSDGFIDCTFDSSYSPNLFFLHGGLHLFESGIDTEKRVYEDDNPIIQQVSDYINNNDQYPLFVAEGSSEQKLAKIGKNNYLTEGFKDFEKICNKDDTDLFIFGHSLSSEDEHFLSMIRDGKRKISRVFVSVYRGGDKGYDQAFTKRAEKLGSGGKDLEVLLFDADSANVWGRNN